VIVAASLCPWPPVLARELTGRDSVLPDLRKACAEAAERLVRAAPELIAVVGPAAQTRRWDPDSRLDLTVFAPGLPSEGNPAPRPEAQANSAPRPKAQANSAPRPKAQANSMLPPSVGLGALLLDQAGYSGPRVLQAVSEDEETVGCAELGAAIGGSAERVGLLVMGDGSARRSPQAPGYLDERAAAFDAEAEQALRRGDLDALLTISPGLARELMATGRPAWQVMAGAIRPGQTATDVLYSDAPFGVGYLVAYLAAG
jgi:hypothetical protein